MKPLPDDFNGLAKDSLVASLLGGLAMTARLLLSTEPVSVGWVVRRLLAASITAVLVGFGIKDQIQSESLRLCVIGVCGYASPEACDFVIKYFKARSEKELANAKKRKPKSRK